MILCEGLLTYLPGDVVLGLWERTSEILSGFSVGLYLADLRGTGARPRLVRGLMLGMRVLVRGRVHQHFEDPSEAVSVLLGAGFASAEMLHADTFGVRAGEARDRDIRTAYVVCARSGQAGPGPT